MSKYTIKSYGKSRPWYSKTILDYVRANEGKALFIALILLFCSFISAQIFIFNHTFVWAHFKPLSSLPWIRPLFSAITFVTIGSALFALRFYQLLSFVFHTVLHDHEGYVAAKAIIWLCLNYFIYFYVQPIVIRFLNEIISFLCNIVTFVVFLLPSLGAIALFIITYFLLRKHLRFSNR